MTFGFRRSGQYDVAMGGLNAVHLLVLLGALVILSVAIVVGMRTIGRPRDRR